MDVLFQRWSAIVGHLLVVEAILHRLTLRAYKAKIGQYPRNQ
jgi:hypothetical protein